MFGSTMMVGGLSRAFRLFKVRILIYAALRRECHFCTQMRPMKHFENRYNMNMTTGTILRPKSFIHRGSNLARSQGSVVKDR